MELFPTKSTIAAETASMLLNVVIHTDQGPAFHNELVAELVRLCNIVQMTTYRGCNTSWLERANQEVLHPR